MNLNNDAKTYLDIFKEHYPNFIFKEFYGNYCPAGFFKYGMDMHHPDCSADCDKCWSCTADSEWCESGDYEIPEYWKGISAPTQGEAAVFDMQTAEQTADVFNYAVLSAEMGDYLKRKEEQLKNEYMNFTANCGRIFAEAQEKLAGNNHYNGVFEKWIKSMGFAKSTVYRMIDVHRFYSSQIGTSKQAELFNNLSKSLQYEISKPSAPPELVDKVMSGDITTHKEYIALKKQLEAAEEMNAALSAEKEQFHRASKANLEKLNEERDRNADLERQLKELESRPRDVAVDTEELNRRLTEASAKLQKQAAEQVAEERRDFADKLNRMEEERDRLESRIAELESGSADDTEKDNKIAELNRQISTYEAAFKNASGESKAKDRQIEELKERVERLSDKNVKVFAVKLTVEEFERLMDIAKKSGDPIIANAVKSAQIIRI